MADNIALSSGSGGDTLAADDISTVKHQRVKVQHGADGSATDVSTASPMPVQLTNAALTAAVHAIQASINSSALMDGLTALTPKFAVIAIASAGENNTIVAAVAGKKIRVLYYLLVGETADATVRFEDGAGGTALTGVMPLADNSAATGASGVISSGFSPVGHFETSSNTLLNLECLTGVARGHLCYVEVV